MAGNGGNYAGPYSNADALSGIGSPGCMWQDFNGMIYFYIFSGNSILKFDPVNMKISTFAGTGRGGTPVDGTPALNASFFSLSGFWGRTQPRKQYHLYRDGIALVSTDPSKPQLLTISDYGSGIEQIYVSPDLMSIYYARSSTNQIFKTTNFSQPGEVVAGYGDELYYGDGGDATLASLFQPVGGWQDSNTGSIYISDQSNLRIRVVTDPNNTNGRLSEELSNTITTNAISDTPLIASIKALLSSLSTSFNNKHSNTARTITTPSTPSSTPITKHHLRRM